MNAELIFGEECLFTGAANMRPFTSMMEFMEFQIVGLCERFATCLAAVWPVSSVCPLVGFEATTESETLAALLARKSLFASVNPLMFAQVPL